MKTNEAKSGQFLKSKISNSKKPVVKSGINKNSMKPSEFDMSDAEIEEYFDDAESDEKEEPSKPFQNY